MLLGIKHLNRREEECLYGLFASKIHLLRQGRYSHIWLRKQCLENVSGSRFIDRNNLFHSKWIDISVLVLNLTFFWWLHIHEIVRYPIYSYRYWTSIPYCFGSFYYSDVREPRNIGMVMVEKVSMSSSQEMSIEV